MLKSLPPPDAVKSDGTKVPYEPGKGYNLGVGTYYIDCSVPDAQTINVHCTWDTVLVATSIKYQTSGLPAFASLSQPYSDNAAAADITIRAATGTGTWVTRTFAVAPDGAGGTFTTTSMAVAGGTAGGGLFVAPNNADRRSRTEIITTTGGFLRQHTHGKMA